MIEKEKRKDMANWIVVGSLLIIVGSSITYIVRQKKKGIHCIGCPAGGNCPSRNGGEPGSCCGCHSVIQSETF